MSFVLNGSPENSLTWHVARSQQEPHETRTRQEMMSCLFSNYSTKRCLLVMDNTVSYADVINTGLRKMLNILSHDGNVSQKPQWEIIMFVPSRMATHTHNTHIHCCWWPCKIVQVLWEGFSVEAFRGYNRMTIEIPPQFCTHRKWEWYAYACIICMFTPMRFTTVQK